MLAAQLYMYSIAALLALNQPLCTYLMYNIANQHPIWRSATRVIANANPITLQIV